MIEIKVNSAAVTHTLERLAQRVSDMRPAMRDIADELRYQSMVNFEQQGRPRWQPLSTATLAANKSRRAGGQILRDTGRLMNSLRPSYTGNSATVASDVKYAAMHQFGGTAGRGVKIPARPFLPIDPQGNLSAPAETAVLDIVKNHLSNAIAG